MSNVMDKEASRRHSPSCCLKWPRKFFTVEPILFLAILASYAKVTTISQLVYHSVCVATPGCQYEDNSSPTNTTSCAIEVSYLQQQVQTISSHVILYCNLAFAVPSALISLLFGHLSDVFGRKLFLALNGVGTAFFGLTVVLVVCFEANYYYLVLAYFIDGLGGSYPANHQLCYSYMADITTKKTRTSHFSVVIAVFFLGAMAGGSMTGFIITALGFEPVFLIIMGSSTIIVLYTVFALPESRRPVIKESNSESVSFRSQCRLLFSRMCSAICSHKYECFTLLMLLAVYMMIDAVFHGINEIQYLFALGNPLCWNPDLISYFVAYSLGASSIPSLLVAPLLSYCGVSDHVIVSIGLASGTLMLVVMGLSYETWHMFLGESILCAIFTHTHTHTHFASVPVAATLGSGRGMFILVRSMASKIIPQEHQGNCVQYCLYSKSHYVYRLTVLLGHQI